MIQDIMRVWMRLVRQQSDMDGLKRIRSVSRRK